MTLETVEQYRFRTRPYPCSYLPGRWASLDYRVIARLSDADYSALLARGWRRFGSEFFRPACAACDSCRGLRIDVARFRPARRHRRNLRRNADIDVVVRRPDVSDDHLRLYNAYHEDMHRRRGWPVNPMDADDYRQAFLAGDFPFARQFLFHHQRRLVGVGLADVLPDALSSVYFFHDPDYRDRALGVYSVLQQQIHARTLGIAHQYLGFWIEQCGSMSYKSQYRPHQILRAAPEDDERPVWDDVE